MYSHRLTTANNGGMMVLIPEERRSPMLTCTVFGMMMQNHMMRELCTMRMPMPERIGGRNSSPA